MALVITIFLVSILVLIVFFIFLPLLGQGAPFEPSNRDIVEKMVNIADVKPGAKAADLGSGDGRILISLAKAGAEAHGYEINPFLVWLSRRNIEKSGLDKKVIVHWKSFWREDFSSFDVISIFQMNSIMKALEKKLTKELKSGSKVVSHHWIFPQWPYSSQKEWEVYLYQKE